MSGAYVAKPEVVVTPTVPAGWNPDWPFPGPFPPGFDPEDYNSPGEGAPSGNENADHRVSVVIEPFAGLETNEGGSEDTLMVYIARPQGGAQNWVGNIAAITVPIFPSITDEWETNAFGEIGSVTFEAGEIYKPKYVTVRGMDDGVIDGNKTGVLRGGPTTSSDVDYTNLYSGTVPITNKELNWKITCTATGALTAVTETSGDTASAAWSVSIYRATLRLCDIWSNLGSINGNAAVSTYDDYAYTPAWSNYNATAITDATNGVISLNWNDWGNDTYVDFIITMHAGADVLGGDTEHPNVSATADLSVVIQYEFSGEVKATNQHTFYASEIYGSGTAANVRETILNVRLYKNGTLEIT